MVQAPPQGRAACAVFYLAKMQARAKKWDEARPLSTPRKNGGEPLIAEAGLLRGNLLVVDGKLAPAFGAYDSAMRAAKDSELLGRIEFASAVAHFKQGEFVLAATFRNAAQHTSKLKQTALFNSALSAWLNQGNYERFMDV